MHVGCAHSRLLWPHYRQAVQEAARHLPPGDKALWVASWHSAGAAWTEILCCGLVPEAGEAQLRAIARYDPAGGAFVDGPHAPAGRFCAGTPQSPEGATPQGAPKRGSPGAPMVHRDRGQLPPPSPASEQGLRGVPPRRERHPGVPTAREPPPVPGPTGGFLEAPTRRPLPTVDHRARLHDRLGGPYSGRGVGARMGPVVRRHARTRGPRAAVRRHPGHDPP